jgi:hypothetical protein
MVLGCLVFLDILEGLVLLDGLLNLEVLDHHLLGLGDLEGLLVDYLGNLEVLGNPEGLGSLDILLHC